MRFLLIIALSLFAYPAVSQNRFDIVIHEIMADPSPQVGLPNAEYIELKNISGREINLQGWRLATSSAISGAFPNITLPADSILIVSSTGNSLLFTSFGRVAGISSFPALPNEGSILTLNARDGKMIHFIEYSLSAYANSLKEEGGWSLEMIDAGNPCSGQSNWKASLDDKGGTPGKKNSVAGINKDVTAPAIVNAYLKDNLTVRLQFNESLDSIKAGNSSHYTIGTGISIRSATALPPLFSEVEVILNSPLQTGIVYQILLSGLSDCAGNAIQDNQQRSVGLPQAPIPNDIIINEILFNPKPDAYDYVEFYNRSNKIIDAAQLFIGNRNSTGTVSSLKKTSIQPFYIFPHDYLVVTEDANSLKKTYLVKNAEAVLAIPAMPSFPDDKGTIVLTDMHGNVLDEVNYFKNWHFELITNDEGVALERIDPDKATQDKNNWHSAAATAGYGTPTYKNSQYKQVDNINASIEVSPNVFSPDNDGYNDIASIAYQVTESGYVANVTIFDVTGRLVRHLVKNEILGLKGSWNWNGLDEKGQKLPIGTYIIYTELFNLQGKKKSFKNAIILARRIN